MVLTNIFAAFYVCTPLSNFSRVAYLYIYHIKIGQFCSSTGANIKNCHIQIARVDQAFMVEFSDKYLHGFWKSVKVTF